MTKQWLNYADQKEHHTVLGDVKIKPGFWNPYNRNRRDILVYLPPTYHENDKPYPVIYMHDGQNLFDAHTSYAGEWHVDESMNALSHDGLGAIVVGLPNMGETRIDEYSPFPDSRHGGGKGDQYLNFIVNKVKPIVDRDFRTLSDRLNTGIIGSSMGGLISLYAFFRHPETFGLAAAMSPSFWFGADKFFPYIKSQPYHAGKVYLDTGTAESIGIVRRHEISHTIVKEVHDILAEKGYQPAKNLTYVEDEGAGHNEQAWAHRFPQAVRFLLNGKH